MEKQVTGISFDFASRVFYSLLGRFRNPSIR